MLMYGDSNILSIKFSGEGKIYNLTSLREGLDNLRLLIPPNNIGQTFDREFDINYANYIMDNDMVFCEFFRIIYDLYIGLDVVLISYKDDWCENLLESLLKLIQQRYGYNSVKIDSDEDYIYARNNVFSDFAPGYGVYNLDQDKERFSYIIENFRLHNNGMMPFNLKWIVEEQ